MKSGLSPVYLTACDPRSFLYPITHVLIAVVEKPRIKWIPLGNAATQVTGVSVKIFDSTDINPQQTVASLDAPIDLISHPLAETSVRTNKHNGYGCSYKLIVYPAFYSFGHLFS